MAEPVVLYLDRDLPADVLVLLAERAAAGAARLVGPAPEDMARADGIVAGGSPWDGPRLDRCPRARVLSRSGIGYDSVDVAAATARGVAVCVAPEAPTVSTAEHAVALLLAAAKCLGENQARLRSGSGDYFGACRNVELAGSTLGLVGYGRIARRVGRVAAALDMAVVAFDPFLQEADVELVAFDVLLARADVISLHAPLTESTRGLFDAAAFARVRPGVILVNAARGGLVDQDALARRAGLRSGRGCGALDVTDPEPLPPDHPLLHRADVVVTPHIASATGAGRVRLYEHAIDNAVAVLSGGSSGGTCHVVNPEVLRS